MNCIRKASHRFLVERVPKGTGGTPSYTAAGPGRGIGHGTARFYASLPTLALESPDDTAPAGAHARVGKDAAGVYSVRSVTNGNAKATE
jgi:hypothetical protein